MLRDVEGFLLVELHAATFESPSATRRGFFGPLQGQLYDLDFRQALHIAKRLVILVRKSADFERSKETQDIGERVFYLGADAKDPERVAEYLRSFGATSIERFEPEKSADEQR